MKKNDKMLMITVDMKGLCQKDMREISETLIYSEYSIEVSRESDGYYRVYGDKLKEIVINE